jgi:AbrB family looped-hinge helix DNA binding protein
MTSSSYAIVSSKGQLVIPARIRESMGIEAGTRIVFIEDGDRLILQPETVAAKLRLLDELRGLTAGGQSMTDELLADRRRERERELAKDGW